MFDRVDELVEMLEHLTPEERSRIGMGERVAPGTATCLRCGIEFTSWNPRLNRLCKECHMSQAAAVELSEWEDIYHECVTRDLMEVDALLSVLGVDCESLCDDDLAYDPWDAIDTYIDLKYREED